MKQLSLVLSLIMFAAVLTQASETISPPAKAKTFHDFTVKNIEGKTIKLKDCKDHLVLVVNVASKCGFTKQYADLVKLDKKYREKGLTIIGFPANNFGQQEPGTNKEIQFFCKETYKVDFPMMTKVSVKGDDLHPLFKHLTTAKNPDFKGDIKWNFEKFLIGKDGKLLRRFRSKAVPTGKEVTQAIDAALKKS